MEKNTSAMERTTSVVLDIDSLAKSLDLSSGSPKMNRMLSRKGSCRMERRCGTEDEEIDEASKKTLVKVNSHLEPLITNKTLAQVISSNTLNGGSNIGEMAEGRSKRFNRLTAINPRKILLIFATVSSMGTLILIYFTLAIKRRA
ncbi:hypothetical protein GIB67_035941 [Kingdonia uniflora]|uniref:Uncharacterized protein n=1 Tax=Kingdonia uniflora TaxID=39325 RepID=A0A7J7N140_9MAGN|nr:hypothetical protein GIB67_035941 [Kingdonia uniflora]